MNVGNSIVAVARRFLFVRELGGANCGLFVEMFQRFTGNKPGDSWCCSFVCYVASIVYRGKLPFVPTASCAALLSQCAKRGWIVNVPQSGDIVFSLDASGHAHHVAIYTQPNGNTDSFVAIAGNTTPDGQGDNGDGVYEHDVSKLSKAYARLPDAA
jgi:hypothetical protein